MMLRNGMNVASWIAVFEANQKKDRIKYCPDYYICDCCGTKVSVIRDYCPECSSAMTIDVKSCYFGKTMDDISLFKKHILNSIYGVTATGKDGSSIFSDRIYVDTDSVRSDDDG